MTGTHIQPVLWEGWATEPPPADPQDDEPLRLTFHHGRLWPVTDLPDIDEYQP